MKINHPISIRKTIVTALLLVVIAGACCRAGGYYEARPEDVPEWARQGEFHFIRIDGGEIETWKALRTHWGREFDTQEQDALSNIYDSYQDRLIEKLKQADFNWIWVTWSNGWSNADEKETQRQIKRLIKRAHDEGIKVTAYLSASNMFWESTFRDEPETLAWVRLENDRPVNYGGPMNPMRFIAEVTNKGWQDYILDKAFSAVYAGADAVFFDNIIGDEDGLKYIFSRFQAVTRKRAEKSGEPKVPLYVNAHLEPDRVDINDICEIIWNEYGKTTPGVWEDTGWDVSNARKTRFIIGAKHAWQPHKYECDKYHCGPREKCFPGPAGQKLSIAEAWAFGSSFSRNIEGRFLKSLILDEREALDAWDAISLYNKWITKHKNIYTGVEQVANIALLAIHDGRGYSGYPDHAMAETFIKNNVMFGTKVIGRLDMGMPLIGFRALIIPDAFSDMSEEEIEKVAEFAAGGGAVFAKPPGEVQSAYRGAEKIYGQFKFTPISAEVTESIGKGTVPEEFASAVETAAGRLVEINNGKYVVANLTRKTDGGAFMLHLINYDHDNPAEDVKVKIDLDGYIDNMAGYTVRVMSPDGGESRPDSVIIGAKDCEFTLKRIKHYTVVVLAPEMVIDIF